MRYYCRCSRKKCQTRTTTGRHPHISPRLTCPLCGSGLRIDRWRRENERNRAVVPCHCGNVTDSEGKPFPHRRGGSVWCSFSTKEPTEYDIEARYGHY